MGETISKQEELFVLHQWPELMDNAICADTKDFDNSNGSANNGNKGSSMDFRMSFQEWQALITLLENSEPSEIPSRLCANLFGAQLLNPIVAVMLHACCWFDGSIDNDVFLMRLAHVRDNLQLRRESGTRQTRNEEVEEEALSTALLVLEEMLQPTSPARPGRVANPLVQSLLLWDGSKRPVVILAHVFIVGVVACVHREPHFAETAIQSFRRLQEAMNEAAATVSRGKRSRVDAAACNITEWSVVKHIESALARRQQEQDAADLLSATDRWWLISQGTAGGVSNMTSEERWAAVSSQYIGQQHIWSTLRTHFLSSDVFSAEKPTVIVLFGPSGFGKSEMAKRIACTIHNMEVKDVEASGKLVHIHLPSFCTRDSIYSLVDPPAAHVGEGVLLSALRKHEDAVVVLDEFEKGTAEAIQNLWLSAFQKKGTLRSLKDASRSVSTEKVTFVLTCNIVADTILRNEKRYLEGTATDQAAMRDEWTNLCRETCRRSMHDPFINRVDYFFPFVPYSEWEKRCFIHMQLRRIVLDQRAKGRKIYITPRFVSAIAKKQQTFHASTIENVVRPLLVEAMQKKWDASVLTVRENVAGTVFVAIPTKGDVDDESNWCALPWGEQSLAAWDDEEDHATEPVRVNLPVQNVVESNTGSANKIECDASYKYPPMLDVKSGAKVVGEKDLILHSVTNVEKDLRVELDQMKELLVLKDKEISYLKEKVLRLEKVLAVLLVALMMCMLLLSLLVGVKLVLAMGLMLFSALWLLGMPLDLLLGAIRILYGVLGPFRSAILVIFLSLWASHSVRNFALCEPH